MLSGIKIISRDKVDKDDNSEGEDDYKKNGRKSSSKKDKSRRKKKVSDYSSSDDDVIGGYEKIRQGSRKKKWYSSDEYSASSDDEKCDSRRKGKGKRHGNNDESSRKKSKRSKREYSSQDDDSLSGSSSEEDDCRRSKKKSNKVKDKHRKDDDLDVSGDGGSVRNIDIVRKEMGLDWMLTPGERARKNDQPAHKELPMESGQEETPKVNPRELNPYLRDNGSGYPEDENQTKDSGTQLLSSSLVGDGGVSWRLKALKRAQEEAARQGRNVEEVVKERWGSLGQLAASVASHSAAAPRAHLRAIKSRRMGEGKTDSNSQSDKDSKKETREYLKDVSVHHPEMKAPKVHDSLSWGRRKGQNMRSEDAAVISNALSSLNKFSNDGNFMSEFMNQHNKVEGSSEDASNSKSDVIEEPKSDSTIKRFSEERKPLIANQLAAKAMQLKLKGKHEEAEKLLREAENTKTEYSPEDRLVELRNDVSANRYAMQEKQLKQKGKEEDSDRHLAHSIMKNKQYGVTTSTQADDEYDFEKAPSKKSKRKTLEREKRSHDRPHVGKRIVTQQERCVFCFENPNRPKHLVVAIGNFTYLMLPQFEPVTPGHCCIVTLQHEQGTRMVDDNVWEEIRNFKKCLIMMFAKQDREVVFLETVIWLSQQKRHCLIECIPLPQDIAKEAPLYFKKAIDEAEDEWSQHNAKKLIDTSEKGLRASIPKNFPYFHVEFGLKRGFVHVIDDETQWKTSFGLNVVRGILKTQDENMYRRRRYDSIDVQKEAVDSFAKNWEPFDWTKQLD